MLVGCNFRGLIQQLTAHKTDWWSGNSVANNSIDLQGNLDIIAQNGE